VFHKVQYLGIYSFFFYINDLPYLVNKSSLPILYADDTSLLCSKFNFTELITTLKAILLKINEWFSLNSLTLNLNKTNCLYFAKKLNLLNNLNITYRDTQIHNTGNVKFLGRIIDSTLSWKDHINQLAIKLSSAVYAIRILSSVVSQENPLMIYYAYVHSIMPYGIIFWGNSTYSNLIYKIKKRTVRIIMKARNTDSCRPLFRLLNILLFYSQYIFSVSMFVVKNRDIFILS
jgi:hypothetical protein